MSGPSLSGQSNAVHFIVVWKETFEMDMSVLPAGHANDVRNNTFIGLRILNATTNLAYYEFTDAVTDWNFDAVEFCELYDVATDPHQVKY